MRLHINKFLLVSCLYISFLTFLSSCSSSSGVGANYTAYSYTGTGSNTNWRMVLNSSGAFAAVESTSRSNVLGTFVRDTTTGFVKIQITSASGSLSPASLPLSLVGLEVPGIAFVMQPIYASENALITGVLSGNCPGGDFVNNYLYTQFNASDNLTSATHSWFGTSAWVVGTSTASTPTFFTLTSGFPAASSGFAPMSGLCVSGISTLSSQATGYLMSLASFYKFSQPSDKSGILTLPAQTIVSLANLNGNYAGLIYDGNANTVIPAQTVLTASGSTAALTLSNVGADLLTPTTTFATLNIAAIDSPSKGFMTGTIGGGNIACTASLNLNGHNNIFCVGQNPASASKAINVVLISR